MTVDANQARLIAGDLSPHLRHALEHAHLAPPSAMNDGEKELRKLRLIVEAPKGRVALTPLGEAVLAHLRGMEIAEGAQGGPPPVPHVFRLRFSVAGFPGTDEKLVVAPSLTAAVELLEGGKGCERVVDVAELGPALLHAGVIA